MNEYAALETYSIDMISGMTCIKSYQKEHVFFRRLLFFYKNQNVQMQPWLPVYLLCRKRFLLMLE